MSTGPEEEWERPAQRRWGRRVWLFAALAAAVAVGAATVSIGGEDDDLAIDEEAEPDEGPPPEPPPLDDAARWQVHAAPDNVQAVAPGPEGVWVGTRAAGLVRWDPESGDHEHHDAVEQAPEVAVAADGTVWAVTRPTVVDGAADQEPGVWQYDGDEWTTHSTSDGLASDLVLALAIDHDDVVWAATPQGLSSYDGEEWTTHSTDEGLPHSQVLEVAVDADGHVWAVTRSSSGPLDEDPPEGVARFDGAQWDAWTTGDGLPDDGVMALASARDGGVWIISRRGPDTRFRFRPEGEAALRLLRFDGQGWTAPEDRDGDLPVEAVSVTALAEDEDRTLWAVVGYATAPGRPSEHRVVRLSDDGWTVLTAADGLVHDEARSLAVDHDGEVWVATAGGLARFDGADWTGYATDAGPAGDLVTSVISDEEGSVWIAAHDGGVSRHRNGEWTSWTADDGLADDTAVSLAVDGDGAVWAGTPEGASRFDGRGWQTWTADDGLGHHEVHAVAAGDDGAVWAAVGDAYGATAGPSDVARSPHRGLARFDGEAWIPVSADDLPDGGVPTAVAVGHDGEVWAALAQPPTQPEEGASMRPGGVARFDGDQWTVWTAEDGLPSDGVTDVAVDDAGAVWAATAGGVARFDGQRWVDHATEGDPLRLSVSEPAAIEPVTAVHVGDDGAVWVGTQHGLSRYDGWEWATWQELPVSRIESIAAVDGQVWVGTQTGLARFEGR